MDAALKKKWIAALRSDEYKQTQGYLRISKEVWTKWFYPLSGEFHLAKVGYCCLGVLAELATGKPPATGKLLLGPKLRKTIGMEFETERMFSTMNDEEGLNFKQIATFIGKSETL